MTHSYHTKVPHDVSSRRPWKAVMGCVAVGLFTLSGVAAGASEKVTRPAASSPAVELWTDAVERFAVAPKAGLIRPAKGPGIESSVVERYRDGTPRRVENRREGQLVDVTHLFRDGQPQHVMKMGASADLAHVTIYHSSGVAARTFSLRKGVVHGDMFLYDAEGQVRSVLPHEHGKPVGLERTYRPDGTLLSTSVWHDGLRHGALTTYYASAKPTRESEVVYSKGVPANAGTAWWPSGNVKAEFRLLGGMKHGDEVRFADGPEKIQAAIYRYAYGQLDGLAQTYWPNGRKATEVRYLYGQATGPERHWHDNGQIAFEVNRHADTRQGLGQMWGRDGQLLAKLNYASNLLDGDEVRFYPKSGAVRARFKWRRGVMHGVATLYRDAGKREAQGQRLALLPMKEGKIHGTERRFHPDGRSLWMTVQWSADLVDGEVRIYRPDRTLERINRYKAGVQEGDTTVYDPTGKKRVATYPFVAGKPTGVARRWWTNGQIKRRWPWGPSDNGLEEQWHPNGKLQWRVPIGAGAREGLQKVFAEAGWLWAERTWSRGVMTGEERRYYRSGKVMGVYPVVDGLWHGLAKVYAKRGGWLWSKQPYVEGKLHGKETRYGSNGRAWAYFYWEHGKLVRKVYLRSRRRRRHRDPNVRRFRDGRIVYYYEGTQTPRRELRPTSVSGVMIERLYWQNGALRVEAPLRDGKRDGDASFWHDDGRMHARVTFKSGLRHGSELRFYPTGEKKLEIPYRQDKPHGYARTFFRDGVIQSRYPIGEKPSGVEVQYHHNGAVRMTVPLKTGKRHGFARLQGPYGRGVARLSFYEGTQQGVETQYHHNGKIRMVVPSANGKRQGRAVVTTLEGRRWAEIPYEGGVRHGLSRRFGKSGVHVIEERDYRHGVAVQRRSFVTKVRDVEPPPPPTPPKR